MASCNLLFIKQSSNSAFADCVEVPTLLNLHDTFDLSISVCQTRFGSNVQYYCSLNFQPVLLCLMIKEHFDENGWCIANFANDDSFYYFTLLNYDNEARRAINKRGMTNFFCQLHYMYSLACTMNCNRLYHMYLCIILLHSCSWPSCYS